MDNNKVPKGIKIRNVQIDDTPDESELEKMSGEQPDEDAQLNYEQRAIKRRLTEIEYMEDAIARERREWFRRYRILLIVILSVIVVALIFIGIKFFNDYHNPMSTFIRASGNNLGSSFHFTVTTEKNHSAVMAYTGDIKVEMDEQRVTARYDADYRDYRYTNVIYTDGKTTYLGNYYNNQWTPDDCTARVHDFFDFYTDYRRGKLDVGSFLRFFDKNGDFSSEESQSFVDLVRERLSTDSDITKISTIKSSDAVTYRYDIDFEELINLIVNKGASMFIRSSDYDAFVKKVDLNRENIASAQCTVTYTVTNEEYLSRLDIEMTTPSGNSAVRIEMSDFNSAEPQIPDDFYAGVGLED